MTDKTIGGKWREYLPAAACAVLCIAALGIAMAARTSESVIREISAEKNESAAVQDDYVSGYSLVIDKQRERGVYASPVAVEQDDVVFSLDQRQSAYITEPAQLEMYAADGMEIYYTGDGSAPGPENGTLYTAPIEIIPEEIPEAYHYAAVAVSADGTVSDVYYTTYFAGTLLGKDQSEMLIFSIDIPDKELWGMKGIFFERNLWGRGMNWEKKAHIELYDTDGSEVFDMYAGMRLYGNYSRTMIQKPMRFSARTMYDELDDFNTLDMFGELYTSEGVRIDRFEDLILRNAGNDFGTAFMRDEVVQTLMRQQGFPVTQPVRPCLVYINGTLYGMYWIHETYKNNYFENRYEMYDYQGTFVVLDGPETAKEGVPKKKYGFAPNKDYIAMYQMSSKDMKVKKHYEDLREVLDVDGYLQMQATMAYVDNGDWPQNNNRAFKYFAAEGEDFSDVYGMDGRWYFVPHDTDWAFFNDVSNNTLLRNYDKSQIQYSPLFCALMEREDCRRTYVTYFLDMMNHAYKPDTMAATIRGITAKIRPAIELYLAKSPYIADNFDLAAFDRRSERVAVYAENRADHMRQHLEREYKLTRRWKLTIDVPDGAGVKVNTITKAGDFEGFYYTDYLTYVSPIVPLGYEFDHWLVRDEVVTKSELELDGSGSMKTEVQLVLRPVETLVIESVSYDKGYIVLRNPGESAVNAADYALSDKSAELRRFPLPDVDVPAGERICVFLANFSVAGTKAEHLQADFTLKKGETVYLSRTNPESGVREVTDEVKLPELHAGSAYVRVMLDGSYHEVLTGEELPR